MPATSRPNDNHLASFCWQFDTGTVEQVFERAQSKLNQLGMSVPDGEPFPRTAVKLGNFNGHGWLGWIDSVGPSDSEHIVALKRLVATCRIRLGYDLDNSAGANARRLDAAPEVTTAQQGDEGTGAPFGDAAHAQESSASEPQNLSAADKLKLTDKAEAVVERGAGDGEPTQAQPSPMEFGPDARARTCSVEREATAAELCLNVDDYAKVLSTFFQSAVGEFCFALFGPWGRGKTHLMRLVTMDLQRHGYQAIWFTAWKYRTPLEIWAHLYETMRESLRGASWFARIGLTLRTAGARHGFWRVAVSILGSFLIVLPIAAIWNLIAYIIGFIGAFAVIFLVVQGAKGYRAFSSLHRQWAIPTHRERLGIQAMIGDDLKALLIANCPRLYFGDRRLIGRRLIVLFLLAAAETATVVWATVWPPAWLKSGVLGITPFVGLETWKLCLPIAIWWAAIVCGAIALFVGVKINRQLVLIVDDLDRCEFPGMVEVIESIKLLLQDDEVMDRIQVVMLVEEVIVRDAVRQRLAPFSHESSDLNVAIDQHLEKLFVSFLRLPPLNLSEAVQVAERHFSAHRKRSLEVFDRSQSLSDGARQWVAEAARGQTDQPAAVQSNVAQSQETDADRILRHLVYSPHEESLIIDAMRRARDTTCMQTPRSIRAILFKYQIVRLLLDALDIRVSEKELIDAILERRNATDRAATSDFLNRIADHVA